VAETVLPRRATPAPQWRRIVALAVSGSCLWIVVSFVGFHFARGSAPETDYRAFYTAYRLLDAGRSDELYDFATQRVEQTTHVRTALRPASSDWARAGTPGHPRLLPEKNFLPFVNPPHVALVGMPLGWLSLRAGYAVFSVLSIAILGAALAVLLPIAAPRGTRDRLTFVVASLGMAPVGFALLQGAWSPVLTLGMALAVLAWREDRPLLMAAATPMLMTKPQHGVLFVVALLTMRRWRLVAAMIGAGLATVAATAAVLGPSVWSHYARATASYAGVNDRYGVNSHHMVNVRGLVGRVTGSATAGATASRVALAIGVVTTVAAWHAFRRRSPDVAGTCRVAERQLLAATLVLGALTSVHAHTHDLLLLLVPLALVLGLRMPTTGTTGATGTPITTSSAGTLRTEASDVQRAWTMVGLAPLPVLFLTVDSGGAGGNVFVVVMGAAAIVLATRSLRRRPA
jgi:hypothetical protein